MPWALCVLLLLVWVCLPATPLFTPPKPLSFEHLPSQCVTTSRAQQAQAYVCRHRSVLAVVLVFSNRLGAHSSVCPRTTTALLPALPPSLPAITLTETLWHTGCLCGRVGLVLTSTSLCVGFPSFRAHKAIDCCPSLPLPLPLPPFLLARPTPTSLALVMSSFVPLPPLRRLPLRPPLP